MQTESMSTPQEKTLINELEESLAKSKKRCAELNQQILDNQNELTNQFKAKLKAYIENPNHNPTILKDFEDYYDQIKWKFLGDS
ncbi:MAG: hypothetical protein ABGW97_07235 [Christiangramia sp.]|uniref:hypothetical protein n=1 Tax=Christiangramia sp. TaxID=1931228 RepID=UPI003242E3F5